MDLLLENNKSSKMVMEKIRDRVRGVITGIAAGDRIGGPIRMAVRLSESFPIHIIKYIERSAL